MEETQAVTMLQRPNIKPLQLNRLSNGHLNDNGGHTFNNKDQNHNANTLKTNRVLNIDMAECSVRPNCKNYSNSNNRNKNRTLRRSRRTQPADEESPSKIQPKEQNETESEESKSIGNVKSEGNENMNRVQRESIGCKDVVILNSEEDTEAVFELRKQLLDLDIPELTVDIFDNIHLGKNEMESIRLVSQEYTTALVYETHNFCQNEIRCHQADILYTYALKTNIKVIPVWAENSLPRFTGIKGIQLGKKMSVFSDQVKGLVMAGRKQLVF
ncbi:uncharacterized protein LOC123559980 [Mercenaria mercenaria]|uniref:uncharacterized protein LOC123559980 n=1 Tax=Mercenaria mercenaria TaxID=6596 RepID=UPI001E1E08E2|nr:uncharacterized protein LOC123559980 [Mercenaria mercenaria]XP_045208102.1 uncharacterized protein LOC123559980 [Mercenaria mercenaria]XP_053408190.1 uncharacterized protein LOC123559980 [Mercenaria mercenaria]XP_053408191.1 uncharacterized protein LOC123559980 [Mercenaria mercenaria]XP_053408192.1 uncharacterized protein LOC123559980 [Mercenaria mercenaria]